MRFKNVVKYPLFIFSLTNSLNLMQSQYFFNIYLLYCKMMKWKVLWGQAPKGSDVHCKTGMAHELHYGWYQPTFQQSRSPTTKSHCRDLTRRGHQMPDGLKKKKKKKIAFVYHTLKIVHFKWDWIGILRFVGIAGKKVILWIVSSWGNKGLKIICDILH